MKSDRHEKRQWQLKRAATTERRAAGNQLIAECNQVKNYMEAIVRMRMHVHALGVIPKYCIKIWKVRLHSF